MRFTRLLIASLLFVMLHQTTNAQSGNWAKAGNSLTGTEKLGSTNGQPVRFFSKNLQRMTLDTSGKLGIGTTKPISRVHIVNGKSGASVGINNQVSLTIENSTRNLISMLNPSTEASGLVFGNEGSSQEGGIIYNEFAAKGLSFLCDNNVKMVLTRSGQLGVGTPSPKGNLHVLNGFSGVNPFPSTVIVESNGANFINLSNPATASSGIIFSNTLNPFDGSIIYNTAGIGRGLQFKTGGDKTAMVITSAGKVGIGAITPRAELDIIHVNNTDNGGLFLQNSGPNLAAWRLFVNNNDRNLQFFSKSGNVASIDDISGAYLTPSDGRLKRTLNKHRMCWKKSCGSR